MGDPVAFLDQNGDLSVTLFGSSSDGCRPVVRVVEFVAARKIRLIVRSPDRDCTADYSPTTSVIRLDDRVDVTGDLGVEVVAPFGEMTFVVHPPR